MSAIRNILVSEDKSEVHGTPSGSLSRKAGIFGRISPREETQMLDCHGRWVPVPPTIKVF